MASRGFFDLTAELAWCLSTSSVPTGGGYFGGLRIDDHVATGLEYEARRVRLAEPQFHAAKRR